MLVWAQPRSALTNRSADDRADDSAFRQTTVRSGQSDALVACNSRAALSPHGVPACSQAAPPAGSVLGPVVTEFGCHVILVTKREQNREQARRGLPM